VYSYFAIEPFLVNILSSLSEFGCNTNTRQFNEIASLYSNQMTSVYSGGLVYEYSQEASKFGLVEISGGNVKTLPDYDTLKSKLAKTPAPSDDGGYKQNGGASTCPPRSDTWDVDGDGLPAIPAPAMKYMSSGAGKGPGLTGDGSQNAGTQSTGTATAGSGKPSQTGGSASSKGAAASVRVPEWTAAPFVMTAVVFLSTLAGAALL
jgi:1,3-beta-glucanosyltransferase GAS5